MRALVTGAGGFLGGAIARKLIARGDSVRSFARGEYPALKSLGVEVFRGDLADATALSEAARECDVVVHVAAKAGIWGDEAEYYRINVIGTKNVIEACRKAKINRLVYTSTPSVVFNGKDMCGVDESVAYPSHYDAAYPKTKALAERLVLAANDARLATVALRPHLIWGPGDSHLIPRIIAKARAKQLRRIGRENKLIDCVYVDNAADAHVLACDRLSPGATIAGKAYFVSQGEPIPLWDLVNRILECAGLSPITRSVPESIAYAAGWILETCHRAMRYQEEPRMTRFLARELATAHWFNISASRRDLGYNPAVSIDEGMRRLASSLARE